MNSRRLIGFVFGERRGSFLTNETDYICFGAWEEDSKCERCAVGCALSTGMSPIRAPVCCEFVRRSEKQPIWTSSFLAWQ
jgi:hypothetical protein